MIKNYLHVIKAIVSKCKNWPHIILAKILNLKLKNISLKNNQKIYVGDRLGKADLSMFSEIFYKQYYNPKGFEINEGDIVFDVGANSGFFTLYSSSKATNGKVFAFEPVPYLFEKINKTVSLNDIGNVVVENIAIGKDEDSSSFYISKDHNGCHSFYKRDGELDKVTVKSKGLEKYCRENNITKIDFLKLDCEGAEYDILNNDSFEFIKNSIGKIAMEYHDNINNHKHTDIVRNLSDLGFYVKVNSGYIYAKNGN